MYYINLEVVSTWIIIENYAIVKKYNKKIKISEVSKVGNKCLLTYLQLSPNGVMDFI